MKVKWSEIKEKNFPFGKIESVLFEKEKGIFKGVFASNGEFIAFDNLEMRDGEIIQTDIESNYKKKALNKSFVDIFKHNVLSDEGKFLGEVVDFEFDFNFGNLQIIVVQNSFAKVLKLGKRLFNSSSIIKIDTKKIVVKDKQEKKNKINAPAKKAIKV